MTKLEELMRLADECIAEAARENFMPGGFSKARAALESSLKQVCTELEVLRDAVEAAYDFITAMSSDPDCDDDGTQGAIRATRRKMAEALGNALPRLLYEKREGQKLFGLRYRELAEENAHLRDALVKAEENLRRPLPSRPDFRASWNPPSNYSDAYDWHQYLDKPEEKEQQPVNGPGTAVDSRSAARSSSLGSHSQPIGIVSSGVLAPSRATLSNEALQGPVATLHDDGCFTWKRDEFRLKYDRQRAGWRMDVYASPPELKAPMAWDDRPLLAHCLEAVNAACSAWSDVRNLNGDIDGGKCAAAAALERIAKDRIKELAAQCASPPEPEPETPAARRLTDEEVEVIVRQQYSPDISPADWARSAIRVAESALATLWGVKLP